MKINRLLTNICSENLEESKQFYTSLFNFNVEFESDWFINLISKEGQLELGLITVDSDVVPEKVKGKIKGAYLTFVVDDVEVCFATCQSLGYEIIQEPKLTDYGQKRMLIIAPEGTVCDVSSPNN